MLITKTYSVDYAHRLKDHKGKCRNLHGHTGVFTITFSGEPNDQGMIVDFGQFDWLENLVNRFDHCLLLQITDPLYYYLRDQKSVDPVIFEGMNCFTFDDPPTAESMIECIVIQIKSHLKLVGPTNLQLNKVDFAETPGNIVSWVRD